MGRIAVTLFMISCLFFASCEKEDSGSLAGTTWLDENWESSGQEHKIVFTSTDFNYTITTSEDEYGGGSQGTYTYDPPTVKLITASGVTNTGTVKKGVMYIDMLLGDHVLELKLKKQ